MNLAQTIGEDTLVVRDSGIAGAFGRAVDALIISRAKGKPPLDFEGRETASMKLRLRRNTIPAKIADAIEAAKRDVSLPEIIAAIPEVHQQSLKQTLIKMTVSGKVERTGLARNYRYDLPKRVKL